MRQGDGFKQPPFPYMQMDQNGAQIDISSKERLEELEDRIASLENKASKDKIEELDERVSKLEDLKMVKDETAPRESWIYLAVIIFIGVS